MINLREIKIEDTAFIVEQLNKLDVIEYLTSRIPYPYIEKDAYEWIAGLNENNIIWAVEFNGVMAGIIGVNQGEFEYKYNGEIGYWLSQEVWGKGLATKAIQEMTNYIFNQTEMLRLSANVFSPNKASMIALEKNGYELEAIHKKSAHKHDKFFNMHLYVKRK